MSQTCISLVGVDVQHIQIASSGVIHDNYVYVGKEITFTVEKTTQNMVSECYVHFIVFLYTT